MIIRYISIVVLLVLLHFYFYGSRHIQKFDYQFYDFLSNVSDKIKKHEESFYSVIVDIDEKSLLVLGQWPWSRVIDAELINRIEAMNPSAIGLNILFPEEDKSSPLHIQKFYKDFFDLEVNFKHLPEGLKDHDSIFSASLQKANATLAIYLQDGGYTASECENISYYNNTFSNINNILKSNSLLCNYDVIQKNMNNFGFINAWRDEDGVFRRIPLFIQYHKKVFPSFALATVLSFDKYIELGNGDKTLLVNFSKKKPKVFSAIDILQDKVPHSELQGKIVIVGSSVVGLNSNYRISNGDRISNNMIHACVIDNILTESLIKQPNIYKQINILLSFLLSLIILFLFSKKLYIYIVALLFIASLTSFLWLVNQYGEGVYVSIGYLWISTLYTLVLLLLNHLMVINRERQEQEKFLIRQSKLASMGEMITLISHQWRQPLSSINGIVLNIDMDQRKKSLNSETLDEYLTQIEDTTAYLSKTINDFTDFFSVNKSKDVFDIDDVITQAVNLTVISSQKDIDLIYHKERKISIIGYKSELIQSILIVLNNAIYACRENGKNKTLGKIIIYTTLVGSHLFIFIEDTGGGIHSKDIKKIFDPYFTTKKRAHGTGLGLYILKLLVENSLNGEVTVKNGKEGAIFVIKIPTHL